MLTLRIRGPKGESKVVSVPSSDLFGEFKNKLRSQFNIDTKCQLELSVGYPPQVLSIDDNVPLDGHIITNSVVNISIDAKVIDTTRDLEKSSSSIVKKIDKRKAASASTTSTQSPVKKMGMIQNGKVVVVDKFQLVSSSSEKKRVGSTPRTRRRSNAAQGSSESDISEKLLLAVSGSTGQQAKALRAVFRAAVGHQYDETQSIVRLAAVRSGNYTLSPCENARVLGSGASSKYEATYWATRGISGRQGSFSETVDILSVDLLQAALTLALQDPEGHGKEILRPENLSKCSPRILWSIVLNFGSNIENGLRLLFPATPETEWAFLGHRKRMLSEKARANAALQQTKLTAKASKVTKTIAEETIDLTANEDDLKSIDSIPSTDRNDPMTDSSNFVKLLEMSPIEEVVESEYWLAVLTKYITDHSDTTGLVALASMDWNEAILSDLNSSMISQAKSKGKSVTKLAEKVKDMRKLTADQLESWVAGAQEYLLGKIWSYLCGGSGRLRRLFSLLRITSLGALKIWRLRPSALVELMKEKDPNIDCVKLVVNQDVWAPSSDTTESIDTEYQICDANRVTWMTSMSNKFVEKLSWIEDMFINSYNNDSGDVSIEDAGTDQEIRDVTIPEEGNMQCLFGHHNCGSRVRLDMGDGWWEEGTVVGYIPGKSVDTAEAATLNDENDIDPPLWRVCLDDFADNPQQITFREQETPGECVSGAGRWYASPELFQSQHLRSTPQAVKVGNCRVEDLEEHELLQSEIDYRSSVRAV